MTSSESGRRHALQVAAVLAGAADLRRLVRGAGAELDLETATGEQDGDRRSPAAGADHGGAAHRRQAAEVLPLELDVGPDPRGDGRGQRRRGALGAGEGHRRARFGAAPCAGGSASRAARAPCRARRPGPRGAGLQREAADAALRAAPASRCGCACPRGRCRRPAALEHDARGLHRLLVGLAAADREGAEPAEQPALPALLEQLHLGHVVHRPPPGQAGADHERVEEAAVVGGDDQAALDPGVLAAPGARGGSRRGRAGCRISRASR